MKKPKITICTSATLDGKISTKNYDQVEIADGDKKEMHKICRKGTDAIMVGGNTLIKDNPSLEITNKADIKFRILNHLPEQPAKVTIKRDISKLDPNSEFFIGNSTKYIFTTTNTSEEFIKKIKPYAKIFTSERNYFDLKKAMNILYNEGIRNLMVEGGGTLNFKLLEANLVDEIRIKIGNYIFGGNTTPTIFDGEGFNFQQKRKTKIKNLERYENYIVLHYKVLGI